LKILIVGAGPAGLYLAYLLKRHEPRHDIRIVEQNDADSTFGFGVVFSDRALDFLRHDDEETHRLIASAMQQWTDLAIFHRGQHVVIDGVGFAAIGRLALLKRLRQRVASVGVVPEYRRTVATEAELSGYDVVVGADGVHSVVRRLSEAAFGTRVEFLSNRFVWYGTTRAFETLSQTFVDTPFGPMNAHHYRYGPAMSTFIAECGAATWRRAGFETMDDAQTQAAIESAFADTLQGHPLIANKSIWRRFPKIRNDYWSVSNRVLVGDALHTAHFSIGSGTRLAFEDAIALAHALRDQRGDVPAALRAYEIARRPIVDKLVAAANRSADWYEHFGEHMLLDPWQLAWSYIQRSGRVDVDRLALVSPRFVAQYEARIARFQSHSFHANAPRPDRTTSGK
jgi:2-polyprenyl-6-methoxyphenol hydroxylase-like FAD-dependent oxidoreductase